MMDVLFVLNTASFCMKYQNQKKEEITVTFSGVHTLCVISGMPRIIPTDPVFQETMGKSNRHKA